VEHLMQHSRIIGIKDSSGDIDYFAHILALAPQRGDWSVLCGNEGSLAEALRRGAHGGVPGGANVLPCIFVKLYEAAMKRDSAAMNAMHEQIIALGRIYDVGDNRSAIIASLKCAAAHLGLCRGELAPPLQPL